MPDPFGLQAGSTPPIGIANYLIAFHTVPKPHPAFQSYKGIWSPEAGLVRTWGSSKTFEDETDCRSARALYEQVKRQLTQIYGAGSSREWIEDDATWSEEDEFWSSLHNGERTHLYVWDDESCADLDSGIKTIVLSVLTGDQYDSSEVMLSYEFAGYVQPEIADEYGIDSL